MTIEEKVLEMLMSSDFEIWYESEFMDYVEGEKGAPDLSKILDYIRTKIS